MLSIHENVIKITKGDTGLFNIQAYTPNKKIYKLKEGDKIVFYLSKIRCDRNCCDNKIESNSFSKNIVLKKEFKDNNIIINSEDTSFLKYGEYIWKCELKYYENGEEMINTICSGRFYLTCT